MALTTYCPDLKSDIVYVPELSVVTVDVTGIVVTIEPTIALFVVLSNTFPLILVSTAGVSVGFALQENK
jgi:hypothetical protein